MPGFSELNAEIENDRGMELKWGEDWRELLYYGFEQHSRTGLAQEKLASIKDSGNSAISLDPQ
jgi:hypothetical protein